MRAALEIAHEARNSEENGPHKPVSFSLWQRDSRIRALGEKCGVFGIRFDDAEQNAAEKIIRGLLALQHRGDASAGIAVSDGESVTVKKGPGTVKKVFPEGESLPGGSAGIGHVRYRTSGRSDVSYAHPILVEDVGLAVAHNGNIANAAELKKFLRKNGLLTWVPQSVMKLIHKNTSDTQMIAAAIAHGLRQGQSLEDAMRIVFPLINKKGAFS
ncbi:MAG: hypothetical protein KGJ13_10845, partial [Patescibacteria group bacterium]|nr:hypothetical protein [Patescibacteria group bacterium]